MATRRSTLTFLGAASAIAITAALTVPAFANETLKIGFVGVTSGPAAAWGTSNVRSMQTLEDMWNAAGGVKIGDKTYDIDVVTFDDQKDPKLAIQGMEKMAQEGIHYVVGPNVDDGAAAVRPVAEKNNIIYFPYAFPKSLYEKPASNAVLGMVANYQSGPAIYKYLRDEQGREDRRIRRRQRVRSAEPARRWRRSRQGPGPRRSWLDKDTYAERHHRLHAGADADGVAQARSAGAVGRCAGQCAAADPRRARARLYGLISTETAQDAGVLKEGAGDLANGFISVGGASTPEIASDTMKAFVDTYTKKFGEYNDESNTKVYALQYIIDTLKANPAAIDNVAEFKKTMDTFSAPNPYIKGAKQADLCRYDLVRPEAPARGADGGQRVSGRRIQDAVYRRCRLTASFC